MLNANNFVGEHLDKGWMKRRNKWPEGVSPVSVTFLTTLVTRISIIIHGSQNSDRLELWSVLRMMPSNSKVFLSGLMNMREKQILASVIEIQKETCG